MDFVLEKIRWKLKQLFKVYKYEVVYKFNKKELLNEQDTLVDFFSDKESYSLSMSLDRLFEYLYKGFNHYSYKNSTRLIYPGVKSEHDRDVDAIEGCARFLPYLAVYGVFKIKEGDFEKGEEIILKVQQIIKDGTNPKLKEYWGKPNDYDQLVVEMADVALAVWILKSNGYFDFEPQDKENIKNWFVLSVSKKTVDNNWHLFKLLIQLVIKDVYKEDHVNLNLYKRIKSFYVGDGWFKDGPNGGFDYYNAWAFHYTLYWINLIDGEFDPDFIKTSLFEFCDKYQYFFNRDGTFPLFGRSLCYRLAVPAPLIAASQFEESGISKGLAKSILDQVWTHFIKNKAVSHGMITQGIYETNHRYIDNYSGPCSQLWSLRSLIMAYSVEINCGSFFASKSENIQPHNKTRINITSAGIDIYFDIDGNIQRFKMNDTEGGKTTKKNLIQSVIRLIFLHPSRPKVVYRSTETENKFLS